jgi:hypothetical protein
MSGGAERRNDNMSGRVSIKEREREREKNKRKK